MASITGSNILVTGAAGFIGSHLVKQLLDRGASVVGVDNFVRDNKENLKGLTGDPRFTFHQADIRDRAKMFELCKGMDYVYHEAAICINLCNKTPEDAISVNVTGTMNLLDAAVQAGCKKFIAASSASVYGDPVKLPIREDHPLLPKNLYGVTKVMDEDLLTYYAREKGLPFIGFRYMNVYGPRQRPDAFYTSVIPLFIKKIQAKQRPVIFGDGSQSMDFVHVDDVVQANILALEHDEVENEFFNVGTATETSIKQLCYALLKLMKSDLQPQFQEARGVDVKRRLSDISKIKKFLSYKPKASLEEGLQTIIDEYTP